MLSPATFLVSEILSVLAPTMVTAQAAFDRRLQPKDLEHLSPKITTKRGIVTTMLHLSNLHRAIAPLKGSRQREQLRHRTLEPQAKNNTEYKYSS